MEKQNKTCKVHNGVPGTQMFIHFNNYYLYYFINEHIISIPSMYINVDVKLIEIPLNYIEIISSLFKENPLYSYLASHFVFYLKFYFIA